MRRMLRGLLELLRDAARVFAPRHLPWHLLAIALTYACVTTGFDAWVAATSRETGIRPLARVAGRVGLWAPILVPLAMLGVGALRRDGRFVRTGWILAEAEVIAAAVCAAYKAVTGRPGPRSFIDGIDASEVFRFGFLRGGLYWGWPSSHVMVAVAGATAICIVHRENRWARRIALAYASYMAVCVSMSFHWFSDALAGVLVGVVVGRVAARPRGAG
jgi:membrane-associated phospholipid phosphatase